MKRMTMADAMVAAITEVSKYDGEVSRVFPLEGSGNKTNGYDYLLIGVETTVYEDEAHMLGWQEQTVYEVQVYCNEMRIQGQRRHHQRRK